MTELTATYKNYTTNNKQKSLKIIRIIDSYNYEKPLSANREKVRIAICELKTSLNKYYTIQKSIAVIYL